MTTSNQHSDQAKQILQHYFRIGVEAAGHRWDNLNVTEVNHAVDSIIDATGQAITDVILQAAPNRFVRTSPDILTFNPVAADSWYLQFPDGGKLPVVGFGMVEGAEDHNTYTKPVTFVAHANGIAIAEEVLDRPWRLTTAKGVTG